MNFDIQKGWIYLFVVYENFSVNKISYSTLYLSTMIATTYFKVDNEYALINMHRILSFVECRSKIFDRYMRKFCVLTVVAMLILLNTIMNSFIFVRIL